jgi:hypothetical protein
MIFLKVYIVGYGHGNGLFATNRLFVDLSNLMMDTRFSGGFFLQDVEPNTAAFGRGRAVQGESPVSSRRMDSAIDRVTHSRISASVWRLPLPIPGQRFLSASHAAGFRKSLNQKG